MHEDVFDAAGDLGPTYAQVAWSTTTLGPPDGWSPALRAVLDTILRTQFPCALLWGHDAVLLYNPEYVAVLGEKHPGALGRPAQEVFPEAWTYISELLEEVHSTGRAVCERDALVPLGRGREVREAYFTFCYSAVCGPTGEVEGVLDIVSETTGEVLAARRLALLDDVRQAVALPDDPAAVRAAALRVLRDSRGDFTAVSLTDLGPEPGRNAPADDLVVVDGPGSSRTVQHRLRSGSADGTDVRLDLTVAGEVELDDTLLSSVRTIGATVTTAAGRSALRAAEREVARVERGFSEALQLSLLGSPTAPAGTEVEVRYRAATEVVRVGGDWYDSFEAPDGSLVLTVGDIAGHDGRAAVAMSQARSVLRGIAYSSSACSSPSPAQMMRSFDLAFTGLRIATTASAVLARLRRADVADTSAGQILTWSNAGHPPPALVDATGEVLLLEPDPQPLLGLAHPERRDHSVLLTPGSTLVLYTDGLVERRGEHLDVGLDRLRGVLRDAHRRSARQVMDDLTAMTGQALDDDVVVMVVRLT